MPTGNLDLKHTTGQGAVGQDSPGDFRTGRAHNLNRQEYRRICNALRRPRRIACVPQPFKIMLAFSAYRRATCATETSGAVV